MTGNNFAALRIAAALVVLIRHSLIILDDNISPFGPITSDDVPALGLWVFFVVSGFLLPAAWERRPHLGKYISARVLRIFPSLAVSLLVMVLVIGMIATTLEPIEFLKNPRTAYFLADNLTLFPNYLLPGVFEANPYPGAVNGALWSLGPLFFLYLMVPVIGMLPWRVVKASLWTALLVFCFVAPGWDPIETGFDVWGNYLSDIMRVAAFFCAGAAIREWRVPMRGSAALLAASALAIVMVVVPDATWPVAHLTVPYVLIYAGTRSTPFIRRAGRFGDPSYGIFLLSFPVQQLLIHVNPELDWIPSILCTVAISTAFGYALWWFVEQPIVWIKRRPGRNAARSAVLREGPLPVR
ncbi:acyltransferase family protein [Plantibacter sp. Mn2098]|uniref:acyltransferase family protein n=1 Tax=Plantibacter sp. Mn2098 TaxID=3395266 RepID=UPI003BBCE4F8